MAIAASTWGSLPVIVERADAAEAVLVCLRMGFGALALAVVVVPTARAAAWPRARLPQLAGLGALLSLNWVLFFRALRLLPGATPVLIGYIFPLLVAIAAPFVLREARERHVVPLAALGFAGLAVILAPQARAGHVSGVVAALGSALTAALLVLAARHMAQRVPGPVIALWQNVTGFVLLLPLVVTAAPASVPWRWGMLMGVVHTAATGILFFEAMRRVPAQEAGVLMYLEPVSAVLFAWAFLGDVPGAAALAGGLLVVGAGLGIAVGGTRTATPARLRSAERGASGSQ